MTSDAQVRTLAGEGGAGYEVWEPQRSRPLTGWGGSGTGRSSAVSQWPHREESTDRTEIVQSPTPMSHRATKGFLTGVEGAGRSTPKGSPSNRRRHLGS